jgi:hypothetical protein
MTIFEGTVADWFARLEVFVRAGYRLQRKSNLAPLWFRYGQVSLH